MCQVLCSGAFNLRQHLEGRKHKGKIEELEHIRKCGGEKANQHLQGARYREKLQELEYGKDGGEVLNWPKWCELCKLWCPSEYDFKQHLEGQKHAFRLKSIYQ